jgi:chitinase
MRRSLALIGLALVGCLSESSSLPDGEGGSGAGGVVALDASLDRAAGSGGADAARQDAARQDAQDAQTPDAPAACGTILLAYYTSWSAPYRAGRIPFAKLTHIAHAFIDPKPDGTVVAPSGYLEPALITGAHAAGVKVVASIGGADAAADQAFRAIAADAGLRTAFAANLETFCRDNGYDGVDVDWEFPQSAADRANLTLLLRAVRDAVGPLRLITAAVTGGNWYGQWLDYSAINDVMSFYNLMAYDMHGSWSDHSGHNAALAKGTDPCDENGEAYLDYILSTRGVPKSKVVFGVPFYGYRFPTSEALFDDCGGSCTTQSLTYAKVLPLVGNGWTRVWDSGSSVPYLTNDAGPGIVTYDDAQSIDLKAKYALSTRGVAGVFMWELSGDAQGDGSQPLLDAMVGVRAATCP